MIPAVQLEALRGAASQHSSATRAGIRLDDIFELVGDAFRELEAKILEATRGTSSLDRAAHHLLAAGGKRVRPLTTLLVTSACGGEPRLAVEVAAATELVHAATLLHDDVVDDGLERRGKPASRVLWGNLVSVLGGDLLLIRALSLVQATGSQPLMSDLTSTLTALIDGEIAQLRARGREDLGLEGYLDIVRGKTASLFRFACRAGAQVAAASADEIEAAGEFGEKLGIAFQIVDDVLDLEGDQERVGKRLGTDLAEGKTTLPLALALELDPGSLRPWLDDARQGDPTAAGALASAAAVREGCSQARAYATRLSAEALAALMRLPESRSRNVLVSVVESLAVRDC